MKYFIIFSFVNILTVISCSDPNFLSGSVDKTSGRKLTVDTEVDNLGKHITSKGELRVLFIFSVFPDDTAASRSWQFNATGLPPWAGKIISSSNDVNFESNNLSQYFYEMSLGNFILYGDVYPEPVIPKFSQDKYRSIAEVNHEILLELDEKIDYSKYDNWSKGDKYKFVKEKDGKVDMIFILYRDFENRLFFDKKWTGAAHMYLTEDIATNDGVRFASGRLDQGSGIQSRRGKSGFEYIKYVLAHEFGHFLFGPGHIENVTNLALMTGGPVWNASRGMHSWERNKLDWIEYIDIPTDKNTSIIANDYLTTGEAYRIKLSDSEWYVIENHQKLSKNDWAQDEGIYIYYINNPKNFAPKITVKCADGNWDFKVNDFKNRLIKAGPNSLGKSEMEVHIPTRKIKYACFEQVYEDNSAWGDNYDAFDINYNNVISPVSNPSTSNSCEQDFVVYIKEKEKGSYIVDIYFEDIYKNSPPSKPQIIGITIDDEEWIKLTWLKNNEPDLAGYSLYTYVVKENDLELLEREDMIKEMTSISLNEKIIHKNIKYAVALSSIDISGNESLVSDYVEFFYENKSEKWIWKRKERY